LRRNNLATFVPPNNVATPVLQGTEGSELTDELFQSTIESHNDSESKTKKLEDQVSKQSPTKKIMKRKADKTPSPNKLTKRQLNKQMNQNLDIPENQGTQEHPINIDEEDIIDLTLLLQNNTDNNVSEDERQIALSYSANRTIDAKKKTWEFKMVGSKKGKKPICRGRNCSKTMEYEDPRIIYVGEYITSTGYVKSWMKQYCSAMCAVFSFDANNLQEISLIYPYGNMDNLVRKVFNSFQNDIIDAFRDKKIAKYYQKTRKD